MSEKDVFDTGHDREQFIDMLKNGVCPFCYRKGFSLILLHINKKHKINGNELKDELMLPRIKGFCDEGLSFFRTKQAKDKGLGKFQHQNAMKNKRHGIVTKRKLSNTRKTKEYQQYLKTTLFSAQSKQKAIQKRKDVGFTEEMKEKLRKVHNTYENYSKIANEFVKILHNGERSRPFSCLAVRLGFKNNKPAWKKVKHAESLGLVVIEKIKGQLYAELTEKAKRILKGAG